MRLNDKKGFFDLEMNSLRLRKTQISQPMFAIKSIYAITILSKYVVIEEDQFHFVDKEGWNTTERLSGRTRLPYSIYL